MTMLDKPTRKFVPRSAFTDPGPQTSTSTIIIIISVLLFCFVALSWHLILRRRARILRFSLVARIPSPSLDEQQPELRNVWLRGACDSRDWNNIMPVCAMEIPQRLAQTTPFIPYTLPSVERYEERRDISRLSPPLPAEPSTDSAVQVAVLISMPSQRRIIPLYASTSDHASSMSDADANFVFPEVMFGTKVVKLTSTEGDAF